MKIIGYLICATTVLIIGCMVLYPMTTAIAGPSLMNLIPFILLMIVPLFFIGVYVVGQGGVSVSVDDDDYEVSEKYEYERKRLSADEKLKNKYVDGVVTDLEYTKKMARL